MCFLNVLFSRRREQFFSLSGKRSPVPALHSHMSMTGPRSFSPFPASPGGGGGGSSRLTPPSSTRHAIIEDNLRRAFTSAPTKRNASGRQGEEGEERKPGIEYCLYRDGHFGEGDGGGGGLEEDFAFERCRRRSSALVSVAGGPGDHGSGTGVSLEDELAGTCMPQPGGHGEPKQSRSSEWGRSLSSSSDPSGQKPRSETQQDPNEERLKNPEQVSVQKTGGEGLEKRMTDDADQQTTLPREEDRLNSSALEERSPGVTGARSEGAKEEESDKEERRNQKSGPREEERIRVSRYACGIPLLLKREGDDRPAEEGLLTPLFCRPDLQSAGSLCLVLASRAVAMVIVEGRLCVRALTCGFGKELSRSCRQGRRMCLEGACTEFRWNLLASSIVFYKGIYAE